MKIYRMFDCGDDFCTDDFEDEPIRNDCGDLMDKGFNTSFSLEVSIGEGAATGKFYVGRKLDKVPSGMTNMFKKYFKLNQQCIFKGDLGWTDGVSLDDQSLFGEVTVEENCTITVSGDESDDGYIHINYGALDIEYLKDHGHILLEEVPKKEFWGNDFAEKYPDMKYILMAVSSALKDFEKKGIPNEKIEFVHIDWEMYASVDIDRLADYSVFEGISEACEDPVGMNEASIPGKYSVIFIIAADYRKNPMCMRALRACAASDVREMKKCKNLGYPERELLIEKLRTTSADVELNDKEVSDTELRSEDEKRWKH